MRNLCLLFTLLSILACQVHRPLTSADTPTLLYPVMQDHVWGYINTAGAPVISPRFHAAGYFSEGLAPVRSGGYYGFIDASGKFVIPPAYDMAYPFEHGKAQVYIDGQALMIDTRGEIQFRHDFRDFAAFPEYDLYVVRSESGKYGVLDQEGKLVIDTAYSSISPFVDGLAVVNGLRHRREDEDDNTRYEAGVIDTKGSMVIPYGKFSEIAPFRDGLASVSFLREGPDGPEYAEGLINTRGQLVIEENYSDWSFLHGNQPFSDGLAVVRIKKHELVPDHPPLTEDREYYLGVMDQRGKIIFSEPEWIYMTHFQYDRAFVRDSSDHWYLMDRSGRVLNALPYRSVLGPDSYELEDHSYFFTNGTALVQTEDSQLLIDTNAQVLHRADQLYDGYPLSKTGSQNIFWDVAPDIYPEEFFYYFAFWTDGHGVLLESEIQDLPFDHFSEGLLKIHQNSQDFYYIDRRGNTVWRASESVPQPGPLNIDFMTRGQFYASSPADNRFDGFGGWGGRGINDFRPVSDSIKFTDQALSIQINSRDTLRERPYWEQALYMANTTRDTFLFSVQDSRLYMKVQAKDRNGKWRDLDYLPNSWCGNSYHTLFLPPAHFWEFRLPVYEGAIKTKLRVLLYNYHRKTDSREKLELLSPEIEAYVNPAQFWRKQSYTPTSIMDPYLE
ncbi:WG repeat-containing protein [Flavilitoribacter nigricans]|nr:WG repeat-containing protein [Flavilitoribacter nigricans]